MSKVDAMRAMREAKHARNGAPPAPPGAPQAPSPARRAPATKAAQPSGDLPSEAQPKDESAGERPTEATEALCGHRNMGGKSCSRPVGHSEKNHRYR